MVAPPTKSKRTLAGLGELTRHGPGLDRYVVSSPRKERRKDEAETGFQLTDPGHFKHDKGTSAASLRSRPASHRNQ